MADHEVHGTHRNHGLTCEQYDALLTRSAGACERCGATGVRRVIDHLHGVQHSGVRGLLCHSCNRYMYLIDLGVTAPDEATARYFTLSGMTTTRPRTTAKLTAAQAAVRLNVSVRTITRYVEAGRLTAQRTVGGHRRFDPAEIDALIAEANPPEPTELPATD